MFGPTEESKRYLRSSLLLLLAGALLINFLILFVGTELFSKMYPGLYRMNVFTDGYDRIAQNIVDGHGYKLTPEGNETMTREPGYIFLLVTLFYVWGKSIVAVKIANFILVIFAVFMMYRLGRLMGLSPTVITIAAAFFLVHPGIIGLQSRGGADILFICQLLCVLYALQKGIMSGSSGYFILAGALLGVTVLTRSLVLPFPGILLIFLIWTGMKQHNLATLLKGWVLLVVAMLIVMSPWVVRNYRLSGKFVPVGSISGMAIYHNVYINKQSDSIDRFETLTREAKQAQADALRAVNEDFAQATYFPIFKNPEDEIAFSNSLKALAIEIIKDDPLFIFGIMHHFKGILTQWSEYVGP